MSAFVNDDVDINQFLYSHHYSGPTECSHDILTLSKLLTAPKPAEDNVLHDTEQPINLPPLCSAPFGPGSIGPPKQDDIGLDVLEQENSWNDSGDFDERAPVEPRYDIVYEQTVNTEDVFLGIGNKTPMTSSCNQLLVKIWLPDICVSDIQLDVQTKSLTCSAGKYKLMLPLPHPVEVKRSESAKFMDGMLVISLRLNREYEFLNK